MTDYCIEIWQDGQKVAAVYSSSPYAALYNAAGYAAQYEIDGPVRIKVKNPKEKKA